jgi:hypothetical protein
MNPIAATPRAMKGAILPLTLIVFIGIHFIFSINGWKEPILGHHAQRQTQTAISAYWIAQGGPLIAYETPLFGPPWSCPMEFPTYQAAVAILSKASGLSIDISGRAISLIFFYLSLPLIYIVTRQLGANIASTYITLSLFLTSPIYLFWSRTMMIESTALFLTLGYLASTLQYIHGNTRKYWWLGLAFGSLAAVTKITTLAPALGLIILLLCIQIFIKSRVTQKTWTLKSSTCTALLIILPILCAKIWIRYSDALKIKNPNTAFLSSQSLNNWNFGDLNLRLSSKFWSTISWELKELATASGWIWVLGAIALIIARPSCWPILLALFAAGCSGFIVFSNLYQVHDYYIYGTAYLFIILVGITIGEAVSLHKPQRLLAAIFMLLPAGTSAIIYYHGGYYNAQKSIPHTELTAGSLIQKISPEDQPIAILGQHYNASLPYYAKRRALTLGPHPLAELKSAVAHLPTQDFFSLLIVDESSPREPELLKKLLANGNFESTPAIQTGSLKFYLSNRLTGHKIPSANELARFALSPEKIESQTPVISETWQGIRVLNIGAPTTFSIRSDPSFNKIVLSLAVKPVTNIGIVSDGFVISLALSDMKMPFYSRRISKEELLNSKSITVTATLPKEFNGYLKLNIDDPAFSRDYDWVTLLGLIFIHSSTPTGNQETR